MSSSIQKRYEGFLNTPVLWKNQALLNLFPFETNTVSAHFNSNINGRLRLGNYVERLVFFELSSLENTTVLAENIQIQDGNTTIGELDCLLKKENQIIHLEIVYKFYLYDASVGESEMDHFIGPNRKDTLVTKLYKLKNKQLPILHSEACQTHLESLEMKAEDILQRVYFKAQLFLPLDQQNIKLKQLNEACINGFYVSWNKINQFESCKFYIPTKKDWLIIPHTKVTWLPFEAFKKEVEPTIKQRFSPMIWIKSNKGELQKCFLVWW